MTNSYTANEHQINCLRTMAGFSSPAEQLAFGAALCAAEAGETLNVANKVRYQGHPLDPIKQEKVLEETGDSLWGLCVALDAAGILLDETITSYQPSAPLDTVRVYELAHAAARLITAAGVLLEIANGVYYSNLEFGKRKKDKIRKSAVIVVWWMKNALADAGFTLDECMAYNRVKLAKRYPEGTFATKHSIARVDVGDTTIVHAILEGNAVEASLVMQGDQLIAVNVSPKQPDFPERSGVYPATYPTPAAHS